MGGILGNLLGGGEKSGNQEAQLAAMRGATQDLQDYRPEAMQGRLNALSNISTAYQPVNNALETMFGGRAKPTYAGSRPGPQGAPPASRPPSPALGQTGPQGPSPAATGQGVGQSAWNPLDPLGIFSKGFF